MAVPDKMSSKTRPTSRSMFSQAMNPRRCTASDSVSIPHKRRKLNHGSNGSSKSSSSAAQDAGLRERLPTQLQRDSSQESGESSPSARQWFDNVNKNVIREAHDEPKYDEDPPFFLGNHVEYSHPPHSNARTEQFGGGGGGAVDGVLYQDSENGDLRGVIDDLTIENKRLRQMLRKRKPSVANHHADDKLLEVRVHGMRADKKRELEALLKNFASSMNSDKPMFLSATSRSSDKKSNSRSSGSNVGGLLNAKQLHTDSGYGSNSTPEQVSAATSNGGRAVQLIPASNKDKHIKSYLYDIPDIWLPQRSGKMSPRSKMALVVRRLEQLFTGKQAAPGEHSQPIQQQEVSKSAAQADRLEDATQNLRPRTEGSREAHILPLDTHLNFDHTPHRIDTTSPNKHVMEKGPAPSQGRDSNPSGTGSPDQRPTRPLDLDIQREQVAEENMEYIRHLGLSKPGEIQSHWIYLNLLISMAQIHTLNVTPEFIRRAIKKLSTKFELSKDGHQVRWKGGADGTLFSRKLEHDLEHTVANFIDSADEHISSSKRSKTSSQTLTSHTPTDTKGSTQDGRGVKRPDSELGTSTYSLPTECTPKKLSAFEYKPMFYKSKLSSRDGTSYLDDSSSSLDSQSGVDATGLANALSKSNIDQHHADEGLLTFYNNPYFCSDFSGDKSPTNINDQLVIQPAGVLGIPDEDKFEESALRYHDACYFTPQFAARFVKPSQCQPLAFDETQIEHSGEYESQPIEWEVSGLGGSTPSDNFAIDVKVGREINRDTRNRRKPKSRLSHQVIQEGFTYQTISGKRIDLQPSRLPPPSYMFFPSSSSSDNAGVVDWSDSDSETSSSAIDDFSTPRSFRRSESSREIESSDEDQSTNESSVDMLGVARAANPAEVAAREREYMLYHPRGPGVAGSLAVTVGSWCDTVNSRGGNDDQSMVDEDGSDESDESDVD